MDERTSTARSRQRAEWMERAQRGDREAYRALLEDVSSLLIAFLRRRLSDSPDLEDVYQETLMALHRARHTYEPSRPFEPWLFGIARHVAIDHARRRLARLRREALVDVLPEVATQGDGPAVRQLDQALGRLSATQREVIGLLYVQGLSVDAAAARAGTTTGAIKVRAHRAYRALKQLLGG
jgi:RNA polymerase sigma-70 factor (ECF subfamily)